MLKRQAMLIALALFFLSSICNAAAQINAVLTALGKVEIEKAKELIANMTDVNQTGNFGHTILHYIVWKYPGPDAEDLVALLFKKGADFNIRNDYGNTPLYIASTSLSARYLVPLLIKCGADVNIADNDGVTPLQASMSSVWGSEAIVKLLLENGASPDVKNFAGVTPLMKATENERLLKIILDYGADIEARDNRGYTALHYAADRSYLSSVQLLIAAGADVNAKTNDGITPLGLIRGRKVASYKKIAGLLVENGAKSGLAGSVRISSIRKYLSFAAVVLVVFLPWFFLFVKKGSAKRVLLSTLLITGLTLLGTGTAYLVSGRFIGEDFRNIVLMLNIILLSSAAGGALAVRCLQVEWREAVLAVLPAAIIFSLYRLYLTFANRTFYSVYYFDMVRWGLCYVIIGVSGMFLLPLVDPAVWMKGPRPTLWKVAVSALGVLILAQGLAGGVLRGYAGFFGSFALGSITAVLLAGAGLALTLFKADREGAWLGAVGITLWFFAVLTWLLAGTPWAP